MTRFKFAASFAALFLAPLVAQAADPLSWSYIDGQYLKTSQQLEVNGNKAPNDDDFEGYRYALNISVYKFFYFTGEADNRRASDYRFGTQSIGFGAHTPKNLVPGVEFYGNGTYERTVFNDVTGSNDDDRDEGYGVQLGARAPFEFAEVHGYYRYMNYGKTDDVKVTGARYGIGGLLQLTPYFGLTLDARHMKFDYKEDLPAPATNASAAIDYTEYLVGFRAYFATDIDRWRRRGGLFGESASASAE